MKNIPFNQPFINKNAKEYVLDCLNSGVFENGQYQQHALKHLRKLTLANHIFLTPSCTDALEMAAALINIQPGDEVIMPSYTFVSTANAFVLKGAVPVFVDIREDTLNIDERLIETAITKKTKAIVAVHYAGIGCDMRAITAIAHKHQLYVIEDAAQALNAYLDNQHLGTFGHLSTFSFHHTKNATSGLGGSLIVNDEALLDRAKCIYTKGTNRDAFLSGQVDKYTWVDVGSSYMMCDLNAALLTAQLESIKELTKSRLKIWKQYDTFFTNNLPESISRPFIPDNATHNAHIYYLKLSQNCHRSSIISQLNQVGVHASFHYIPLHDSPAGKKFGRSDGDLPVTQSISQTILRLPLFVGLTTEDIMYVSHKVFDALKSESFSISS